jgi:hypothetical protein
VSGKPVYAGQWTSIQEQFVDAPADAVSGADLRQAMVHYHALFADLLGEPEIKDRDRRSPPGARASSSPHLTRRRWRNDHAKRDGNESDGTLEVLGEGFGAAHVPSISAMSCSLRLRLSCPTVHRKKAGM